MNKRTKLGLIIGCAALVLIVGLILLLTLLPADTDGDTFTPTEYNSLEATVDESGVRTVSVPADSQGNAKENITGSLIDLMPSYLREIKIENEAGNYVFNASTDSEGSTTYVLVGFEDYDLNGTNSSMIGSAISNLDMVAMVDYTGENAADYGLDTPVVTASAKFTDGSELTLYIGDDAPGGTYTYVMLKGCDSVFSVLKTDIEALLLDLNDMFNLSIRGDYSTVSDEDFTTITLGGTHLEEEVVIEHADGSLDGYYVMASHNNQIVNTTAGSNIIGTIKSLSANSVAFANPDADTLKELGLQNPYATVKAEYVFLSSETGEEDSLSVSMLCSEPDDEGNVYLMDEGGKLVYVMSADSLSWATVTMKDLRSEYVLAPSYSAIKSMTLSQGGESYTFDVTTVITESVDAQTGEDTSTSETAVMFGDKTVDEAYFRVLFEDMAYITCKGDATDSDKGADTLLTVTYEYSTGREADTVVYYATSSQKVIPEVNGTVDCYIYKSDVDGIIDNAKALSEGKEIVSILG